MIAASKTLGGKAVKITNLCIGPGQNAQYIGIGTDLYREYDAALRIYETANKILGKDFADGKGLIKVCAEGPVKLLSRTDVTQPVIFTHSAACYAIFLQLYKEKIGEEFKPTTSAGASLGEYFALLTADVFNFETGLRLVKKRGELMYKYANGKQVAVSLGARMLDELCKQEGVYESNCNFGEQTIVGGEEGNIARFIEKVRVYAESLKTETAKMKARPILLETSAAFHTPLMAEAKKHFAEMIQGYEFRLPQSKVISNYTGEFHSTNPEDIKQAMIEQIDHPVRWWQGMERAVRHLEGIVCGEGIDIIEFGGGKPNIEGPKNQRASFSGILTRNLNEIKEKYEKTAVPAVSSCINTETINKTIEGIERERKKIKVIDEASDVELIGYAVNDAERSALIGILEKHQIRNRVRVIQLRPDDEKKIEVLCLISVDRKAEFPFLEARVGCETGAVLGYYGVKEIEDFIASVCPVR